MKSLVPVVVGGGPEAAPDPPVGAAAPTWEEFCAGYDRCFGRVYAYTSRRVRDPQSCERIVSEVLEAHVALLVDRGDPRKVFLELKAALDRRIGSKAACGVGADESEP